MESKWISSPNKTGWWWCLTMGYAQSITCHPIYITIVKGKPCILKEKKNKPGHKWVSVETLDNSACNILGWQEDPEPYFNPDDY